MTGIEPCNIVGRCAYAREMRVEVDADDECDYKTNIFCKIKTFNQQNKKHTKHTVRLRTRLRRRVDLTEGAGFALDLLNSRRGNVS